MNKHIVKYFNECNLLPYIPYPYLVNLSSVDKAFTKEMILLTVEEFNLIKGILENPKTACMYLRHPITYINNISRIMVNHVNDTFELVEVSARELLEF